MSIPQLKTMRETLNATYIKPDSVILDGFIKELESNPKAQDYLKISRNLSDKTISHFKLGYSSQKNAIVIPVFKGGELINLRYRMINPEGKMKYTQTKGCEIWVFNEEGFDKAKQHGSLLIVEGEFDLMSAWQAGFKSIISPASGKSSYGVWLEMVDNIPKVYICYEPGTKIYTNSGLKKIEEISVGDNVLTHNGVNRRVYEVMENDYSGDMIKFTVLGEPNDRSNFVTENHPLLVYRKNNIKKSNNKWVFTDKTEWVEASSIKTGDYLMYPIQNIKEKDITIDTYKTRSKITERNKLGQVVKTKSYIEVTDVLESSFGKDEMFFYLVGLFLGDGHCNKRSSRFELAYHTKTKTYIIEYVESLFKKYKIKYTKYEKGNIGVLYAWDYRLTFFKDFYKNRVKIVPEYLWNIGGQKRSKLIDGLIDSDGTETKHGQVRFSNTNKEIIHYFEETCLSLGFSVVTSKHVYQKEPTWKDRYDVGIIKKQILEKKNSNSFTREINGVLYLLKPVKSIERKKYSGKVYNIDVENDHSYVTEQRVISHNCYDNDKPGKSESLKLAERIGVDKCSEVYYADNVKDANDFFKEYTASDFLQNIKDARPYYRYQYSGVSDIITELRETKGTTLKLDTVPYIDWNDVWNVVLSGRSGVGKTSYILNIASELANKDIPTLILPFERGIKSVGKRFLQVRYGIKTDEFEFKTDEEWDKIFKESINLPLFFSTPLIDEFQEVVAKAKRLFGVQYCIIDHLDYFVKGADKVSKQSDTIRLIETLAQDLDMRFIVVHHINKGDVSGLSKNKKPTMEMLTGSSDIYKIPEAVLLLYQPEDDLLEVIIDKNKGEEGSAFFEFNKRTGQIVKTDRRPEQTKEDVEKTFKDF